MQQIAIYLLAGVVAGLVSGLFGLGGGLTIVPALAFALPLQGVQARYVMHLAIGTSLVVMVITAFYTTVLRHRRGDVDWPLFKRIAPVVVLGALLGAICGDQLPGLALRAFFIGFVGYTIARALRRRYGGGGTAEAKSSDGGAPRMPQGASLWTYGLTTGLCGALLGAGAAIIIVPYLRAAGYRIQHASAIAAGLSAVIGIGAGVGYVAGAQPARLAGGGDRLPLSSRVRRAVGRSARRLAARRARLAPCRRGRAVLAVPHLPDHRADGDDPQALKRVSARATLCAAAP
jgi:uncharacterized protein